MKRKDKISYRPPPKGRKTIEFSKLQRLSVTNSDKLPDTVDICGRRRHWVGIGWVEEGPALGNEVIVVQDGLVPVAHKGK
jgi:hypothetical protein